MIAVLELVGRESWATASQIDHTGFFHRDISPRLVSQQKQILTPLVSPRIFLNGNPLVQFCFNTFSITKPEETIKSEQM